MKKLLLLLLFFISLQAFGQTAGFRTIQNNLSGLIRNVNTANGSFSQTTEFEKDKPFYLSVYCIKTDKKSRSEEIKYTLNLADIEPASIEYKIQKDLITVNAETKSGQKFIKSYKESAFNGFTNKILIHAENVENARSIVDNLRKIIPLAGKLSEAYIKLPPNSYNEQAAWLVANIYDQELDKTRIEHSLEIKDLIAIYYRNVYEKGQLKGRETYMFNWGDLNPTSVKADISNDRIALKLQAKGKKNYISYLKDGVVQSNENELTIIGFNTEWVRSYKTVLERFIPMTEQRLKQSAPDLNTSPRLSWNLIDKANTKFTDKNGEWQQRLSYSCHAAELVLSSGSSNERYLFYPSDINENSLELNVKGGTYQVELKTLNNEKLIAYFKNGQKQNYVNSLILQSGSLEDFRYLPKALMKVIGECKGKTTRSVPVGSYPAQVEWLKKQLPQPDAEGSSLRSEILFEKECRFRFTESKTSEKKTEVTVYESSLRDLNANLMVFEVSGKNVFVNLYTYGKEKNIKTFKNEIPSNYVNTIKIQTDDVESARNIMNGFKEIIRNCPLK